MLMFNLFKAEPINYSIRTKTLSWRERDNILHKKLQFRAKWLLVKKLKIFTPEFSSLQISQLVFRVERENLRH